MINEYFDNRAVNTEHPLFNRIWQAIKGWDIQRKHGVGYAGANGTDVQIIIDAIELASTNTSDNERGGDAEKGK